MSFKSMNIKSALLQREAFLAIVLFVLIILVGAKNSDFLSIKSLTGTFNDTSILILLALGQMLVILARCIDLSVAANVALTGMVVAMINAAYPNFPMPLLILTAVIIGGLLGSVNGLLIWLLDVPAIVITLGTMSVFRGIIFLLSNGEWVNAHQMSGAFIAIPRHVYLGLPVLSWIAIVVVGLIFYLVSYRPWGRAFYTAGGNPTAAFYTGINVGRTKFNAFVVAGMLSGLCGYLWVSRFAVAYVDVANGFELQVIAACVIGGVGIMGGVGTVVGCVLGALFIGVINNALPIIGISPFWQMAISGTVIIIAVIANSRSERSQGRNILRIDSLGDLKKSGDVNNSKKPSTSEVNV